MSTSNISTSSFDVHVYPIALAVSLLQTVAAVAAVQARRKECTIAITTSGASSVGLVDPIKEIKQSEFTVVVYQQAMRHDDGDRGKRVAVMISVMGMTGPESFSC